MFLSIAVLVLPATGAAQDVPSEEEIMRQYVETARGELNAKRDSALKAMIELDADEAEVFWPINNEFQRESRSLWDAKLKLAKEYADVHDALTTETATRLANRFFELDRERIELRSPVFARDPGGVAQIKHRVALAAHQNALVIRGQETGSPKTAE